MLALTASLLLATVGRSQFVGGWTTVATLPGGLSNTTMTVDNSSRLWVIGGLSNGKVTSAIEVYDLASGTWTAGPTLPTAVMDASALFYGNQLVVFGGSSHSGEAQLVQVYDTQTGTWTTSAFANGGGRMASTIVGSQILALGGDTAAMGAGEFDLLSRKITSLAALPFSSIGGVAVALGGVAYLTNGRQTGFYDPGSNRWSTAMAQLPVSFSQFAAAGDGTYLLVVGGNPAGTGSAGTSSALYYFDPSSNAWGTGPTLPAGARDGSGVMVGDHFLVIGNPLVAEDTTASRADGIFALEVVPEPPMVALLGLGLVLFGFWYRRRPRQRPA